MTDAKPMTSGEREELENEFKQVGHGPLKEAMEVLLARHQEAVADKDFVARTKAFDSIGTCSDRLENHNRIGIPRIHSIALIDGVFEDNKPVLELSWEKKFRKRIDEGKRIIMVAGVVGTGKTLGVLKWAETLGDKIVCKYIKARRLCSYVERWSEDRNKVAWWLSSDVLIIDEMGTESDNDIELLADHMHTMYEDKRTVIGISNMTLENHLTRYQAPMERRIWASGSLIECTEIICPGARKMMNNESASKRIQQSRRGSKRGRR